MNYERIYNELIENRLKNPIEKLPVNDPKFIATEVHHILPSCIGGNNEDANLVRLTAREHYIAHLLLWKIKKDICLLRALIYFRTRAAVKINSKLFQCARNEFALRMSEYVKSVRLVHNILTHKNFYLRKDLPLPKDCAEGKYNKRYDETIVDFDNQRMSIRELSAKFGISKRKLYRRIVLQKWPIDKILVENGKYKTKLQYKRKQSVINKWITNDKEEKQIAIDSQIPDELINSGWHLGRVNSKKISHAGLILISNPKTKQTKYVEPGTQIPDGWKKGKWRPINRKKLNEHNLQVTEIYKTRVALYFRTFLECNLSFSLLTRKFPELKMYSSYTYVLQLFYRYVPNSAKIIRAKKKSLGMKVISPFEGAWKNSKTGKKNKGTVQQIKKAIINCQS